MSLFAHLCGVTKKVERVDVDDRSFYLSEITSNVVVTFVRLATMSDVIATVWDFDKTLIPGYMQEPIFNHFHYDGAIFWKKNNSEIEQYEAKGLTVNHDTYYLNKFIRTSQQGAPFDMGKQSDARDFGNEAYVLPWSNRAV